MEAKLPSHLPRNGVVQHIYWCRLRGVGSHSILKLRYGKKVKPTDSSQRSYGMGDIYFAMFCLGFMLAQFSENLITAE